MDSPTCSTELRRVFLTLIAHFNWTICSLDVKTAFLQVQKIGRDVFLKPPKEADTLKIWKLNKCVYGLGDAARMWYEKIVGFFVKHKTRQSKLNKAFFFYRGESGIGGAICVDVDDILYGGTSEFHKEVMKPFKETFVFGREEVKGFQHLGVFMKQLESGVLELSQETYIENLEEPSAIQDEKSLRAILGKLEWVSGQTRPDICFDINSIRVQLKTSPDTCQSVVNKVIRRLKYSKSQKITFTRLEDMNSWRILVFAEASFANSATCHTQAGYSLLLADKNDRIYPLNWQSKRLNQVIHSTLAAERLALVTAIDSAIFIRAQIQEITGILLPVICYSDNKSLINAVGSTKPVSEKRLRIDVASIAESLEKGEIESILWIRTGYQLAKCHTKQSCSETNLEKTLENGKIDFPLPKEHFPAHK